MSTWLSPHPVQLEPFPSSSTCGRMHDTWQDMAPGYLEDTWRNYSAPFGDNSTCSQGWADLLGMSHQPKPVPRQPLDLPRQFPASPRQPNGRLPRPPSFAQPKQWPVFPALFSSRVDNSSDSLVSLANIDALAARRQLSTTPPLPPPLSTLPLAPVTPRPTRVGISLSSSSSGGAIADKSGVTFGGESGAIDCQGETEPEDGSAHRRAALEFVLELAGPQMASLSDERRFRWCPDSLIPADELPVAAFSVDRELTCVMWNRRMAKLTGLSPDDVAQMGKFPGRLLRPAEGSSYDHAHAVLQAAMRGADPIQASMLVATRNHPALPGQDLPEQAACGEGAVEQEVQVEVHACMRSDAAGAVNGVLCVVLPAAIPTPTPLASPLPAAAVAALPSAPASTTAPPAAAGRSACAAGTNGAAATAPRGGHGLPCGKGGGGGAAMTEGQQAEHGNGRRRGARDVRDGGMRGSSIFRGCSGCSSSNSSGVDFGWKGGIGATESGSVEGGSVERCRCSSSSGPDSPFCHSQPCDIITLPGSDGGYGGTGMEEECGGRRRRRYVERGRLGAAEMMLVDGTVSPASPASPLSPVAAVARVALVIPKSPALSPMAAGAVGAAEAAEAADEVPESMRGPPELHTPREILPSREALEGIGVGATRRFLPPNHSHTVSCHSTPKPSPLPPSTVSHSSVPPLPMPSSPLPFAAPGSSVAPHSIETSSVHSSPAGITAAGAPVASGSSEPSALLLPMGHTHFPALPPLEMKPLTLEMKRSPRLQFDACQLVSGQRQAGLFHVPLSPRANVPAEGAEGAETLLMVRMGVEGEEEEEGEEGDEGDEREDGGEEQRSAALESSCAGEGASHGSTTLPAILPAIRVQRRRLAHMACADGGSCEGAIGGEGGGRGNLLEAPLHLLSPLTHSPYPCSSSWPPDALPLSPMASLPSPLAAMDDDAVADDAGCDAGCDGAGCDGADCDGADCDEASPASEARSQGLLPLAADSDAAQTAAETSAALPEARAGGAGGRMEGATGMGGRRKRCRGVGERVGTAATPVQLGSKGGAQGCLSLQRLLSATALPRACFAPAASAHLSSLPPSPTGCCARALVADGVTGGGAGLGLVGALHNDLPQQLERCGFDVVTAATVTEAVGRFQGAAKGCKGTVCEVLCAGSDKESWGTEEEAQRMKFADENCCLLVEEWSGVDASCMVAEEQCPVARRQLAAPNGVKHGAKPEAPFSLVLMELEAMVHDGFACIRSIRRAEGRRQGDKGTRRQGGDPCCALGAICNMALDAAPADASEAGDLCNAAEADMKLAAAASVAAAQAVDSHFSHNDSPSSSSVPRAVIIAVADMNRWDLAGQDRAMQECMRSGVDAVVPRTMTLQQLKSVLRKLGVRGKYVLTPSSLPRAMSGTVHNPLNLSR